MSTYQAAYKSLLQGVSQQAPEERLPGQLTASVNMLADPVTGIRRRPGTVVNSAFSWAGAEEGKVLGWFTDLAERRVHLLLNTATGVVRVLDEQYNLLAELAPEPYLITANAGDIRATTVGSEFVLANVGIKPSVDLSQNNADPSQSGFFFVQAGAFGKKYDVTVAYSGGDITASYTTPGGQGTNDAELATPEYIAKQLADQLSGTAVTEYTLTGLNITSYSPTNPDPATYPDWVQARLQYNSGTDFAPVWGNVTYPHVVTPSALGSGKYRVWGKFPHSSTRNGRVNCQFTFTASNILGPLPGTYTSQTVQVATNRVGSALSGYSEGFAVLQAAVFAGAASGSTVLFTTYQEGPYVFLTRTGGLSVSTTLGGQYLITSKAGAVRTTSELPARLPAQGNGYVCRVGSGDGAQYYAYNAASQEWLEVGKWGGPSRINDTPVSVMRTDADGWFINSDPYEGRLAGDDESNPAHRFTSEGITGIGTYQGRLVILSGPRVSMSASNRPRRFFRSTVTSVLASDPIEIGSGMTSAAAYEWALPFNKDLIVFSRGYQAVIPSGNTAITPTNAIVTPTSSLEVDTTGTPIVIGRTLMYSSPRSEDFFGVQEMIPSNYTDSQYVSQDATPHLPKYMPGRCRFAVASSVASVALFAPAGDDHSLIVHEYHWDGDTKVQQAWHRWTFPYRIETAYFASDMIVIVHVQNGVVVMTTIDPRAGFTNAAGERRPYTDLNIPVQAVDHLVTLPDWMLQFDPSILDRLRLTLARGGNAGEWVGAAPDGVNLRTVRSNPDDAMRLGIPYYSGVIPTPPVVRDYNQEVIHTDRATLLRFVVGTRGTSQYQVRVSDDYSSEGVMEVPTLTFSHPELQPGRALYAVKASDIVPCRTDMRSTAMEVFTEGFGELNIVSLEYVGRYQPRIARR